MATVADQLTIEMGTYGRALYDVLFRKYPEFAWIEKYVLSGQSYIVSELTGLLSCMKGLDFFWSYECDIDLCVRLLEAGLPVISIIRLKSGTKHVVCIVGCSKSESQLIVHDPLGNYHTDYQDHNGANISFSYELFREIAVGNPLSLFCIFPSEAQNACSSLFGDTKHFSFTAKEVQGSMPFV